MKGIIQQVLMENDPIRYKLEIEGTVGNSNNRDIHEEEQQQSHKEAAIYDCLKRYNMAKYTSLLYMHIQVKQNRY